MYTYAVTVTNVVDGDTVDVSIDVGFGISISHRIRLYGLNTAEIHSTVLEERTKAQSAKKYVQDFVALGNITMESFKSDKYGRYLGKLYSGSRCLNDELLSQNLAAPYFGEGVKSY